jgi:YbbR-like protein
VTVRVLPRVLARNWRLKLAAVGIAVFLWGLVLTEGMSRRSIPVPVRVQLVGSDFMLADEPTPAFVSVRFAGPVREIIRLALDGNTAVIVPINDVTDTDMVVVLQPAWIPVEGYQGVQVEDFVPSTIRLHFEPIETATIVLRLNTTGQVPSRLALTRAMSLRPGVVRVSGAASRVTAVDTLDILPVNLSNVSDQGVLEATVDTAGLGLQVVPMEVTVMVPVEQSTDRQVIGIPVRAGDHGEAGGIVIVPPSVDLTLTGARTRVDGVIPGRLRVFVPSYAILGMLPSEERRVPIHVEGVPNFVTARMDVDSVLVRRQADQ